MARVEYVPNVSGIAQTGFNRRSLAPVGNPVEIVFKAEDTGSGSSFARAAMFLGNASTTVDGQYIQINNRIFYFRDNPNTLELQAGQTPFANGNRFYQILAQDPVLSNDYQVASNSSATVYAIQIDAKFAGAKYNTTTVLGSLSLPFSVFGGDTPATSGNVAQDENTWRVYYRLYVATRTALALDIVNGTPLPTDWKEVLVASIGYNEDNTMADNVAKALAPYVKTYPPPIYDSPVGSLLSPGAFEECPESIVYYSFEYGEEYIPTGETVSQKFKVGTIGFFEEPNIALPAYYMATNAALSQAHSGRRVVENFLPMWFREPNVFSVDPVEPLTQSPTAKDTTIDSLERIYFFYYSLSKARVRLSLRYNVTYIDGSTSGNLYINLLGGTHNTKLAVEVGYRRLKGAFPSIDTAINIKSFTVAVVEYNTDPAIDGVQVTYDKTYKLRNEIAHLAFLRPQLIFLNPLGGYDTLFCYGLYDREVRVDRTQYEKTPQWLQTNNRKPYTIGSPPPAAVLTEKIFAYDGVSTIGQTGTDTQLRYVLRSGAIDKEHARWIQDSLLTSNAIYLLDWQDFDNVGNAKVRQLRQVVFEKPSQETQIETDLFQWEFQFKVGFNLATINQ